MTQIKQFHKFLKDHDYSDSWDARLILTDDYVKYQDQGGWFKLEEDLTFTYHNDDEDTGEIEFNTYKSFITFFKSNYCWY